MSPSVQSIRLSIHPFIYPPSNHRRRPPSLHISCSLRASIAPCRVLSSCRRRHLTLSLSFISSRFYSIHSTKYSSSLSFLLLQGRSLQPQTRHRTTLRFALRHSLFSTHFTAAPTSPPRPPPPQSLPPYILHLLPPPSTTLDSTVQPPRCRCNRLTCAVRDTFNYLLQRLKTSQDNPSPLRARHRRPAPPSCIIRSCCTIRSCARASPDSLRSITRRKRAAPRAAPAQRAGLLAGHPVLSHYPISGLLTSRARRAASRHGTRSRSRPPYPGPSPSPWPPSLAAATVGR